MGAPPDLPARFPCWCRATYSWGGETKRDLGFIEGDLIEALNAGDGLWWMGRLRRDPRAIGMFPSNFVKILDESFQPVPVSRHSTPPQTTTPPNGPGAVKSKSVFRKPFQAYEKSGARESGGAGVQEKATPEKPVKKSSFRPYSSMKTAQTPGGSIRSQGGRDPAKEEDHSHRLPAPVPRGHARRMSRTASPLVNGRPSASPTPTPGQPYPQQERRNTYAAPPPQGHYRTPSPQPVYRAPSPQPMYRAASPQPMYRAASPQPMYRAASPQPMQRATSPAPPRSHSPLPSSYHDGSAFPQLLPSSSRGPSPNPYQDHCLGSRAPSPNPYQTQYSGSRAPSPAPSFGYNEQARAPSPAPSFGYVPYCRNSEVPFEDDLGTSPPPPPPPAHRVAYQPSRAPSPGPQHHRDQSYDRGGSRTPVPPSTTDGSHLTPSPLRDAMNDVMSSLHDMSLLQSSPPATRPQSRSQMWSPDGFDDVRTQSRNEMRAQSSLGFATEDSYFEIRRNGTTSRTPSLPSSRDGPPQLGSYVQRMDDQLQHQRSNSSYAGPPPALPKKGVQYNAPRPMTASSHSSNESSATRQSMHSQQKHPHLRHRKSAYELGREKLNRTYTTKTSATNSTESSSATQSSASTQLTSRSIMSGHSAGGFSATSAGSLARRKFGMGSVKGGHRPISLMDTKSTGDLNSSAKSIAASSQSSGSGPSYHESHASGNQPFITPRADWTKDPMESAGILGGLGQPKGKKSGFFKKMIESAKTTAKTGAANARSTIGSANGSRPGSRAGNPTKNPFGGNVPTGIAGGLASPRPQSAAGGAARDMGMGGGGEWMQVRRDVNRSNTISRREREERAERCDMMDLPVLNPIDQLHEFAEGDEGLDGLPVAEPTDFQLPTLALVDKSTRFINSIPPMINAAALAQSYVCRPHRSDVQRLRAIFTWVAERITWEDDFDGQPDSRRVVQTKRGCSQEIALLVRDMCNAVGLHAELIRGYLKAPGEFLDLDTIARPNHWWNAVIVDGEWRILDCALAGPTYPRRGMYSSASAHVAESWYFLARPMEICYTHVPLLPEQQHIVPAVEHEVLISLPCSGPAYFKHGVELADFSTSALHLENLEMAHFHCNVPEDVEVIAETESRALATDADGDFFESGDLVRRAALAQAEWQAGRKRFTIKSLLPPESSSDGTVLKVYAGKRGLMHSIKDNPHALAFALPLTHTGQNPAYDFLVRHPTPHAQRHDLYVVQPQCKRLVVNNTFVFHIRQHPSSLSRFSPDTWGTNASTGRPASPNPAMHRPTSAMSMVSATQSVSHSGSNSSAGDMTPAQTKPAKLAVQSPSQKIIRLTRKVEHTSRADGRDALDEGLTTSWETVVKMSERGVWRGLVLADRSARWCVFAEWECV